MSDDIVVDHPDIHSGPSGADATTRSIKEAAYEAIVNSPDVSTEDYAEETKDRAAEKRGEELPAARKQARGERFQRALAAARDAESRPTVDKRDALERARDDAADDHRHEEPTDHQREHEEHQTRQRARDEAVAATAKYEMRAAEFEKSAPDFRDTIQSVFAVFPPAEHIAEALLRSPIGPEIAYRLANNIDAIDELNALSPEQFRYQLAQAEGVLAERQRLQQAAPPPRRTTKAPRPISAVRGGAGPSVDASRSDNMDQFAGWLKKDLAKRQGR
jgi:hypothetical protein